METGQATHSHGILHTLQSFCMLTNTPGRFSFFLANLTPYTYPELGMDTTNQENKVVEYIIRVAPPAPYSTLLACTVPPCAN